MKVNQMADKAKEAHGGARKKVPSPNVHDPDNQDDQDYGNVNDAHSGAHEDGQDLRHQHWWVVGAVPGRLTITLTQSKSWT